MYAYVRFLRDLTPGSYGVTAMAEVEQLKEKLEECRNHVKEVQKFKIAEVIPNMPEDTGRNS